jgi:hypothetical protein
MAPSAAYNGNVQFVDRTLLRLADADERAAVLTPVVGNRLLAAAFVFGNVEVGEVTGVSVRDIELLPPVGEHQTFEGALMQPSNGMRWEAMATARVAAPHATVDARVELFLTTETRLADTSIERVDTEHLGDLADLAAVDSRIVADDGALPTDRDDLAARRFSALKMLLHERFSQPDDFEVDGFFAAKGIDTVDELLAYLSSPRHPERVEMELVVDGTLPSRIVNHRVIAAIHIDENPVARLHAVLDEIHVARGLMVEATEVVRTPAGMTARNGLPFVLVFDQSALDDADLPFPSGSPLPGDADAQRAARLAELQNRLTPFGLALAPIST